MDDGDFDTGLIRAAFNMAADEGWRRVTVPAACRAAGLPVSQARGRFPSRSAILLRFGQLADQAALTDAPSEGLVRDRLFDLLMRRFDALQAHRAGIQAVLRSLPTDPSTALMLAFATGNSMRWMLQAAGIDAVGVRGNLQVQGLVAVWLWCLRTWEKDETDDLSGTMAALDTALGRAEQMASWMGRGGSSAPPPPDAAAGAGELDPSYPLPPDSSGPAAFVSLANGKPADSPPKGTPPAPLDPTPMISPEMLNPDPPASGSSESTPPAPFDQTPILKPPSDPDA